jgi:transaldolase
MAKQAKKISKWADNIFVKIPVTNTKREFTGTIISELSDLGVKLNITAVMTVRQVKIICEKLNPEMESIISVFAGRIADTGVDPIKIIEDSLIIKNKLDKINLLWASPREIYNLIQANDIGCDIITMTPDLWKKIKIIGTNLEDYSLATVQMFYEDGLKSGLSI